MESFWLISNKAIMTFGELIKARRGNRTQRELCSLVNNELELMGVDEPLSQATLSAWETDRQKPSDSRSRQVLTKILGITTGEVEETFTALEQSRTGPAEYKYADEVSGWIEALKNTIDLKADRPSIWMIAPDVLPAFIDQSGSILDLWKKNLGTGTDYFVIWYLRHITYQNAFVDLYDYLERLVLELHADAPGRVDIYLVYEALLPNDESYNTENAFLEDYKRYCTKWEHKRQLTGHKIAWHEPKRVDTNMPRIIDDLNHWHVPFRGRLAVYLATFASKKKAQASVLLKDAKRTMLGPKENIYVWLSEDYAEQLRKALLALSAWLSTRPE